MVTEIALIVTVLALIFLLCRKKYLTKENLFKHFNITNLVKAFIYLFIVILLFFSGLVSGFLQLFITDISCLSNWICSSLFAYLIKLPFTDLIKDLIKDLFNLLGVKIPMGIPSEDSFINKMDNNNPHKGSNNEENKYEVGHNEHSDTRSDISEGSLNTNDTTENNKIINEALNIKERDDSSGYTSDLTDTHSNASTVIEKFEGKTENEVTEYFKNKRDSVNSKYDNANRANNTNYSSEGDQDIDQRDENRVIIENKRSKELAALNEREDVVKERLLYDNLRNSEVESTEICESENNKRKRDNSSSESELPPKRRG